MSITAGLKSTTAKDADRLNRPSNSPIVCLSVNNSGSRVINTRTDRSIRVWRSHQSGLGEPLVIENAHAAPVTSVSWVPDKDTTFASAGGDHVVKIWQGNGSLERDIPIGSSAEAQACKIVSYSPDGAIMLAATTAGRIYAYDVLSNYAQITVFDTAAALKDSENDTVTSSDETSPNSAADIISDIKWTNRGHTTFYVGLSTGPLLIVSCENHEFALSHVLDGCRSITCLLIDPRGLYIAAGSKDGAVYFWSTSDMINYRALTSIDQEVSSLAASCDGVYFCVGYAAGSNSRIFGSDSLAEAHEIPDTLSGPKGRSEVAFFPAKLTFLYSSNKNRTLGYMKKEDANEREGGVERERERDSGRGFDRKFDRDRRSDRDRSDRDRSDRDRSDRDRSDRDRRGDRDRRDRDRRDRDRISGRDRVSDRDRISDRDRNSDRMGDRDVMKRRRMSSNSRM